MRETTMKPGEELIIRCAPAESVQEGPPEPPAGISLADYAAGAPYPVEPGHPEWPTGPDGEPVPGTHVWRPAAWVPAE